MLGKVVSTRKNAPKHFSCGQESGPHPVRLRSPFPTPPSAALPPAVSLSLFLSRDSRRRVHEVLRRRHFVPSRFVVESENALTTRNLKQIFLYFPRLANWTGLENNLLNSPVCFLPTRLGQVQHAAKSHRPCEMGSLRTETLAKALAEFISFWAQHGPPEDRDTCERLSGFHFIPGATRAT